uniref:Uncharacterized protein n=1 Tax=Helianthus annuus TaxID=4232 RepID=A0A251S0U0_HELAN
MSNIIFFVSNKRVDENAATWFSNICLTLSICIKTNFPMKCGTTREWLRIMK